MADIVDRLPDKIASKGGVCIVSRAEDTGSRADII